jgi:hypothetical protein
MVDYQALNLLALPENFGHSTLVSVDLSEVTTIDNLDKDSAVNNIAWDWGSTAGDELEEVKTAEVIPFAVVDLEGSEITGVTPLSIDGTVTGTGTGIIELESREDDEIVVGAWSRIRRRSSSSSVRTASLKVVCSWITVWNWEDGEVSFSLILSWIMAFWSAILVDKNDRN